MSFLLSLITASSSPVAAWVSARVADPVSTRWAHEIAAGVLVALVATLFWTLRLHRLVRARTAELEAKNRELEQESSDRKTAIDALQLADHRLRMAMQAAQLRTWHWDVATDRFEVIGDRPTELGPPLPDAGSGLEQFLKPVHPDDIGYVRAELQQALTTGNAMSPQFRVVLPDGSIRWKLTRGCVIRDANNEITSVVGVVMDVTERYKREEELNRSEERYCELFDNANDIVYTHDLTGNFTTINHAAERVLGYSRQEVLCMNVRDVVMPEQVQVAQEMIARKVAGDASRTEYELDVRSKTGRRVTLEVNTRLIREDGKVVGVQGIARDVTERKRLEWQLSQSQKMEAVGQLAGGIAHDFNNLLTAIIGNAQLGQLNPMVTPEVRECLSEVAAASHRAAALTRQLLVFSRQEQVDRHPMNITVTLGNFMKMLRRIIGEHIDVKLITAATVPTVYADSAQLEQVVLNLAVNARDAMPSGGRLTIDVDDVTLTRPEGTVTAPVPPGRYARIRVSDTGCGMKPEVKQRIFEPFFTTKGVGEGTGLGLSVVYGIVRQHEGFIDVTSAPGNGTQFTVYLPAYQGTITPRATTRTLESVGA